MDALRLDPLVPFIVAWHNRHPLAHAIRPEQVQSLGYVVLPYHHAGGGIAAPEDPVAPAAPPTDVRVEPTADDHDAPPADAELVTLTEEVRAATLRHIAAARASGVAHFGDGALQGAPPATAAQFAPPPKGLSPLFSEPFYEFASARRVARWAQKNGLMWAGAGHPMHEYRLEMALGGAPIRAVLDDPTFGPASGKAAGRTVFLVLRTASIEVGGDRLRLLLGPGPKPTVFGPRCWGRKRVFSVLAVGLCSSSAAMGLWLVPGGGAGKSTHALPQAAAASAAASAVVPATTAASAASAEQAGADTPKDHAKDTSHTPAADTAAPPARLASASAWAASAAAPVSAPASALESASASAATPASTPTSVSASAPVAAASAPDAASESKPGNLQPTTAAPQSVEARLGKIDLPPLASLAAMAQAPQIAAMKARPQIAGTPAPPAIAPGQPVFALSTRLLRTAAESEQLSAAMRKVLTAQGAADVRVEVIPVGDDWRVVGWPYTSRSQADKARAQLTARGLKVEVVDF